MEKFSSNINVRWNKNNSGGKRMSEHKIELTGWKAIVVVVVLIGVLGARLMTFNDKKDS